MSKLRLTPIYLQKWVVRQPQIIDSTDNPHPVAICTDLDHVVIKAVLVMMACVYTFFQASQADLQ